MTPDNFRILIAATEKTGNTWLKRCRRRFTICQRHAAARISPYPKPLRSSPAHGKLEDIAGLQVRIGLTSPVRMAGPCVSMRWRRHDRAAARSREPAGVQRGAVAARTGREAPAVRAISRSSRGDVPYYHSDPARPRPAGSAGGRRRPGRAGRRLILVGSW